jgi:hypothetical protein
MEKEAEAIYESEKAKISNDCVRKVIGQYKHLRRPQKTTCHKRAVAQGPGRVAFKLKNEEFSKPKNQRRATFFFQRKGKRSPKR